MAATIQVRALSPTGDPLRGAGLQNFLSDLEAVAQIIVTTLRLLQAEWFENLNIGTPLFQQLLDHGTTQAAVALILRQRILGCPYVTGINSFSIVYGALARTFSFTASIATQFGTVNIAS